MRIIQWLLNRSSRNKNTLDNPKVFDETTYLLSSKANAERLLRSLEHLRNRPTQSPDNHPHLPLINRQRRQQPNDLPPRDIDQ